MKALSLLAVTALAVLAIALSLDAAGIAFVADRSLLAPSFATQDWTALINLKHNAFMPWRYDSWLLALANILPVREALAVPLAGLLVFSSSFLLLLLRISAHRSRAIAVLMTAATAFAWLGLFGWDTVVFSALAWVPLLVLCLIALLHGREALGIFILASCFFSFRLLHSANELAPLLGIVAVVLAGFVFRELRPSGRPVLSGACILGTVIVLGFAAAAFDDMPSLNSPGYPYYAHVVRDDDIAENVHPLIGPSPRIPYIDRDAVREYSGPSALITLLLALYLWLGSSRSSDRFAKMASSGAVALSAASALDIYLPSELAFNGPLAALARIIPGACVYPLSEISLALGVACIAAAALCSRRVLVPAGVCAALGLIPPLALVSHLPRLHFDFSAYNPDEMHFVVSPSLPVLNTLGPWILRERLRIERTEFLPNDRVPIEVVPSHTKLGNETALMFDLNRNTRWSPGRALQDGSEWLYVRLSSPQTLSGIELAGGFFKSDFPRALRISILADCPEGNPGIIQLKGLATELIHYRPWEGAIAFTPYGYPFYTAQTRVQAYFPHSVETRCLLLEQTGQSNALDWSVAELRLGVEGNTAVSSVAEE